MNFLKYGAVIAAGLSLSGCGMTMFTEPATNPVVEDRVGDIARTLATKAERRLVLFPTVGENRGKFCAEPSPDATESLTASFAAALTIHAKTMQNDISGGGNIARSLATAVGQLPPRTQGLQLYRNGVYALCQSRINDFITADEYAIALHKLRDASERLIAQEIKLPNWNANLGVEVVAPAQADQAISSIALKPEKK